MLSSSTFGKNDRINKPFDVFSQALVTLGAKKESVETIQSFIKTKHKNPILAYEELFRITGVQYLLHYQLCFYHSEQIHLKRKQKLKK